MVAPRTKRATLRQLLLMKKYIINLAFLSTLDDSVTAYYFLKFMKTSRKLSCNALMGSLNTQLHYYLVHLAITHHIAYIEFILPQMISFHLSYGLSLCNKNSQRYVF